MNCCNLKGVILNNGEISRCTESELQDWLEKEHKIIAKVIYIGNETTGKYRVFSIEGKGIDVISTAFESDSEAMKAVLFASLSLI